MLGCNSLHWARNPHNWGETSSGFLPVFNTAFLVAPRHRSYCSLWSYRGNVRSSDFPPLHTFREEASCALTTQAHTRCGARVARFWRVHQNVIVQSSAAKPAKKILKCTIVYHMTVNCGKHDYCVSGSQWRTNEKASTFVGNTLLRKLAKEACCSKKPFLLCTNVTYEYNFLDTNSEILAGES